MFTSSRCQAKTCPFAVNVKPARLSTGPVGPCSPGIHCGYTRVSGPGSTGIVNSACRILRAASVKSTVSAIGRVVCAPGCANRAVAVSAHAKKANVLVVNSHHKGREHGPLRPAQSGWRALAGLCGSRRAQRECSQSEDAVADSHRSVQMSHRGCFDESMPAVRQCRSTCHREYLLPAPTWRTRPE